MITIDDYAEWCRFAGVYIKNYSHGDRYRTYAEKLSPAGTAALVVYEFLQSQESGIDVQAWRTYDVYEMGADLNDRLTLTSQSLAAVGAPKLAEKTLTAKSNSLTDQMLNFSGSDPAALMEIMKQADPAKMMDDLRMMMSRAMPEAAQQAGIPTPAPKTQTDPAIETREELQQLLATYVSEHEVDLRADMERLGDPRTEPGFDPEARLEELDAQLRKEYDLETQQDDCAKLQEYMEQFEKRHAKVGGDIGKLSSLRRKLSELYRSHAAKPDDDLIPAMRQKLSEVERFQEQYAGIFRPSVTKDADLQTRLNEFGPYRVDAGKKTVTLTWDKPRGFECDWTTFMLEIEAPSGKDKALRLLLDAAQRLRKRFPEHQAEIRERLLESFSNYSDGMADWEWEDDEVDDDGNPTEESILANCENGSLRLSFHSWPHDEAVAIDGFFNVDWDEEHGFQFELADEPDGSGDPTTAPEFSLPGQLTFADSGRTLSPADIIEFESKHAVEFPGEYRAFLLCANGGRPEPNHLKLKVHGETLPVDIRSLFSIDATTGDNDLGAAIVRCRTAMIPDTFLPIGTVSGTGLPGEQSESLLLMIASGKKAGRVLVNFDPGGAHFPKFPGTPEQILAEPKFVKMLTKTVEQMSQPAAAGIADLLSKLKQRPEEKIPAWLAAIRNNDLDALLAWLTAKGKLSEKFSAYGDPRVLTVVSYLASEAPPDFLRGLVERKIVKPKELREHWSRWNPTAARFGELMQVFGDDQWKYAFLTPDIWDNPDLLARIADAKVDFEAALDDEGATPLHRAVQFRRADGVVWLLKHGAAASTPDKYARTALVWAEDGRQLDCLKLLLEAGESLENLFPHMPTMTDKLRLIKSRWFDQFEELRGYLQSRGVDVSGV